MVKPSLGQTFKTELLSINSLVIILFSAFIYYSLSVLLINYRLLASFVFGKNLIFYKLILLKELIIGARSALGDRDFIILIFSSLLVGANILLLYKTLKNLKNAGGKLSLTVGGVTTLGIMVAGSCSCGFSLISVLGLSGALAFLPFGSLGIHIIVVALLILSLWFSLRSYREKVACRIK